jgi:hypothetical protein
MGLLDDLKQQADLKQQDDSLRAKPAEVKADVNKNLLLADAKLKHGIPYWTDIFNSLNIIKPVIPRYYYVEGGAAKLDNLLQCDYSCNGRRRTVAGQDYVESIVLRFRCIANDKIKIEKQSDQAVKRLHDHLFSSGLKFEMKEVRNDRGHLERGIFTVNCEVPVTISINADLENGLIKIITRNLEKLGEYSYIYDFEEFGKHVFEELGKVIIAKPNTFRTTGKHQLAMTTTTMRAYRAEISGASGADQTKAGGENTGDQAKNLRDMVKSLLKR